jgi:hypothetical protein
MNVCLVSAPVATDFKKRDEIDSCLREPAVSEPQLGILSLAAVLEARCDAVRIIDLDQAYLAHLDSQNEASSFAGQAANLISADPADVYGFSSICSSYPLTIRIAEAVKDARPGSLVLFGGPQASVVDRQTLAAFSCIDFVLRGESETTLPILLDELAGEGKLSRVSGLTYRCGSEICRNASAPIIEDLDTIPPPAYHLTSGLQGATKASLELGRGCPFACTFCSTNDFFRRRFRLRSPGRVIRDMREIASAYGIQQFELVHDMFTVDRRRVVSFCEAMLASGDGFKWSCSARTDSVDEELLDLMARAGCVGIFYGVESGSQRLQKVFDKDLDVEQARRVVTATEHLGMRSTVSLITGFPEETEDDVRLTLRMFIFSARHPQSTPHLNILAPLAETPIHLKYRDQMTLGDLCSDISQQGPVQDPEDWNLIERHAEIFPNFYLLPTPHLDRGRLLELREFALNGVGHFRWLLCAIHQSTYPLYDLFFLWQKHRMEIHPLQNGPELKWYYNSASFRRDFLSFVQSSLPADNKIVGALLEFETAWSSSSGSFAQEAIADETSSGAAICMADFPVRSPAVNLIELSFDLQRVINAVKNEVEPVWDLGSHYYVTPESSDPLKRLYGISNALGQLLQLCNGQQDVRKIVELLAPELPEIAGSQRKTAVLGLLKAAVQEGLVSIHCAPRPLSVDLSASSTASRVSPIKAT